MEQSSSDPVLLPKAKPKGGYWQDGRVHEKTDKAEKWRRSMNRRIRGPYVRWCEGSGVAFSHPLPLDSAIYSFMILFAL